MGESAVGAGVRRIEAKTGHLARHHLNQEGARLRDLAALLKSPPDSAAERLAALVEERRRLERELTEARKKLALGGGSEGQGSGAARQVAGVNLLSRVVTGIEMRDLKALADEAKKSVGSGVVAIVGSGRTARPGWWWPSRPTSPVASAP